MLHAAERMAVLINDLLAFSRVSSRGPHYVPVDLAEVVRGVLGDLEMRLLETDAEVVVEPLPTIDADPLQMRQLMQNLLSNALKFRRPDVTPRVVISARWVGDDAAGRVEVAGAAPKPLFADNDPPDANANADADADADRGHAELSMLELSIQDNGIGFDEKYLDRIFDVFQRLHGRSEYHGTGIGLAVCRTIAHRHGGTITARSTPGQGSTFLIRLRRHHHPKPA